MLSSRSTHHLTDGRTGAKTPGRENTIHRAAGKGNLKNNVTVPLHPTTQTIHRTHKDSNIAAPPKSLLREVARPLVDKTPFPNQLKTPLPDNQKLAKLLADANRTNALFLDSKDVPNSAPRASSARAHVRAPRLSANNNFETPLNGGHHWDVSEAEIAVPEVFDSSVESEACDEDEIEYMPPKFVETYTPPFDFPLPNYSLVGKGLLSLAHSYPYDDALPVEIEPTVDCGSWDMFTLPEMNTDDPFLQDAPNVGRPTKPSSRAPEPAAKPSRAPSSSGSRPETVTSRRLNSRPGTSTPGVAASKRHVQPPNPGSATNTTVDPGSKSVVKALNIRRPATAAAMYPSKRVLKSTTPSCKQTTVGSGEIRILDFSSPDVGDDFRFDV